MAVPPETQRGGVPPFGNAALEDFQHGRRVKLRLRGRDLLGENKEVGNHKAVVIPLHLAQATDLHGAQVNVEAQFLKGPGRNEDLGRGVTGPGHAGSSSQWSMGVYHPLGFTVFKYSRSSSAAATHWNSPTNFETFGRILPRQGLAFQTCG